MNDIKTVVPTSQRTQSLCIRKANRLRLLGEIIRVYFVSLRKYMNSLYGKMQNFLTLQQVVYTHSYHWAFKR